MRHRIVAVAVIAGLLGASPVAAEDWNQFRGPRCDGVTSLPSLPTTWSADAGRAWKTKLPGPGTSQPVAWKGRIYVTAYSGYGEKRGKGNQPENQDANALRLHVLCLNAEDGKQVWHRQLNALGPVRPPNSNIAKHGYATPTPYVDNEGLYCSFGTAGVFAMDHVGEVRWTFVPGSITHIWGCAASLAMCDDLLIVNASSEADQLIAVDRRTGKVRWRQREGFQTTSKWNRSWSTPMILPNPAGGRQIVVLTIGWVYSYAPDDGGILWRHRTNQGYASNNPTWHDRTLYAVVGSSHGDAISWALSLNPADEGKDRVRWKAEDAGANICSAVYREGYLYWAALSGGLRPRSASGMCCLDARTGELKYRQTPEDYPSRRRSGDSIYASTLCGDGKLYYVSQTRGTWVVAAEPTFKVLAHNTLADDETWFNAPAVPLPGGRVLLRSDWGLHCVGGQGKEAK